MKETIEQYFACWIDKDESGLADIFSEDIVYSECYGPEYAGRAQIIRWFREWNSKGTVLEWTIRRCIEQNNVIAVEWFFSCEYEGNIDGFDGVTIAVFDGNAQICNLKEFQSKAEHYNPYDQQM